jgi:membrane-bound lytic murein transglycosylase F
MPRSLSCRLIGVLALLIAAACSGAGDGASPRSIGGLDEVLARGTLRILRPTRDRAEPLPRTGNSLRFEYELVETYCSHIGVEPEYVYVDSRDRLIPSLLEGRGDVIVGNMTVTEKRREQVAFTVSVAVVREQLVKRANDVHLVNARQLAGRRVAVRPSSSFWSTLEKLRARHAGIEVQQVSEDLDIGEILERVALGQYDVTIADSNVAAAYRDAAMGIVPAFDVSKDRPIAWAVRPGNDALRRSLDQYLTKVQLYDRGDELLVDDLDKMRRRRSLRLVTPNSPTTYFMWRGELMGFEYELVREFARSEGLRLEVVVPPGGNDLFDWLRDGRGDIVADNLSPPLSEAGVALTTPFNHVTQVVISRRDERTPRSEADLAGRVFTVKRSSSYWTTLESLLERGVAIGLQAAPENESTEEIIGKVAAGEYDLTLADDTIAAIELSWRSEVTAPFAVTDRRPTVWAVRDSNPELLAALDGFVAREYRGLVYNVIRDRYFGDPARMRSHHAERITPSGSISPYDELVKKYAGLYGFDWLLIVAQMYQESRFDPTAQSFAGARGLMQVLPRTGLELGFENLDDPESAIHAGVKYLDWARERFPEVHAVRDRTWFALAAYNAGPGHVRYARRLAEQEGLDPNRWFGNVENAMLLLSRPSYAQDSPHGYCRCSEPVRYVREIRSRYNAYVEMLGL